MAGFLNIVAWWQRLRHSRGFGIHSPFAYHFITEVLNQPYAYYAYESLATPEQRLIYRVALSFGPGSVYCAAPLQYEKAARLALRAEGPVCFALIDCAVASPAQCALAGALLKEGIPLMIFNAEKFPALLKAMTFRNARGTVVAVPFPHLPRQHFQVRF